jgi:SAM-dependent methyltransferase
MISETIWKVRRLGREIREGAISYAYQRRAWRRFWQSYRTYRDMAPPGQAPRSHYLYPCLGDDTPALDIEPTYYYQDAWAFEHIVRNRPTHHIDIGSHHKFVALLSKVVRTTSVDLRPPTLAMESIEFKAGSILALPFDDRSVPSVSSLCVVEHIGLGRYGDELDPYGTQKAMTELKRIVAPGGHLYLSVPLHDTTRVYFNAHRAFQEEDFLKLCEPFAVAEKRYIYGKSFGAERLRGFGTGCYLLRRSA